MNKKSWLICGAAAVLFALLYYFGVYNASLNNGLAVSLSSSPKVSASIRPTPDFSAADKKETLEKEQAAFTKNKLDKIDNFYKDYSVFEKKLVKALEEASAGKKDADWHGILKGTGDKGKKNQLLFDEYMSFLIRSRQDAINIPGLDYWDMFFDISSFKLKREYKDFLPENDEFRKRSFSFLTDLDPLWCIKHAHDLDSDSKEYSGTREELPLRYQAYWDDIKAGRNEFAHATVGISHILFRGYDSGRGKKLTGEVLWAINKSGFDMRGKALADIGSGSGMALPFFREAIGKDAKMYAVERDPYTVDVMRYMAKFSNAEAVDGKDSDCCLPPESVDVITLIGVHMGSGLTREFKTTTAPWLQSMRRALRPGGIMVIHDGDKVLLYDGLIEKTEAQGFKLRGYYPGQDEDKGDGNCNPSAHDYVVIFDRE